MNRIQLPDPKTLKRVSQLLATLDAILEPEWQYRYYSYNKNWSEGEELSSMRDGQGSDFFLLFRQDYVFLKGFDPELGKVISEDEAQILQQKLPEELGSPLAESAFMSDEVTFIVWRLNTDEYYNMLSLTSKDEARPLEMLNVFNNFPREYYDFACQYYEYNGKYELIKSLCETPVLIPELVYRLNPEAVLSDLSKDLDEIGVEYNFENK